MLTPIKIIALIFIVVALIKTITIAVKPKAWMKFVKGFYSKPKILSFIALVLATVVFYFLIQGGMTIVQILATSAFFSLVLLIGLAPEVPYILKKYEEMVKKKQFWKAYWFYTLIWMVLLVLGLIAIFR